MSGKAASRVRTLHPARAEEIREKIKSTLIINKLENHILNDSEMSSSQVSAALGLLRKSVPDLTAVEHKGKVDHNLTVTEIALVAMNASTG